MVPAILIRNTRYTLGFLRRLLLSDQVEVWLILANLLYDPRIDNRRKFDFDFYPHTEEGQRQYRDDKWIINYIPSRRGDVEVILIGHRAALNHQDYEL